MSIRFALEHKDSDVGICLLQDAVYLGCKGRRVNRTLSTALKHGIPVFAAKKDVELRGLQTLLYPEINVIDYDAIIDLVLKYEQIINM